MNLTELRLQREIDQLEKRIFELERRVGDKPASLVSEAREVMQALSQYIAAAELASVERAE
jgi:hypothetical protein